MRNELTVRLHGDGAGATLDGLFLARGEQQVDNHTLVDHARPHCGSQQYYKGILDGSARGAFDGKVIVRPAGAFTDAHQKNRNLLLSDTARIDAKPQLEIYNNDVKCTHGSATGRLDADALFYLRSRALSEEQARSVLTLAFASEIVDRVPLEPAEGAPRPSASSAGSPAASRSPDEDDRRPGRHGLRRRGRTARLPAPGAHRARAPPRLPRQREHDAEARGRDPRLRPLLPRAEREHPPLAPTASPRRRRRPTRAPARRCGAS